MKIKTINILAIATLLISLNACKKAETYEYVNDTTKSMFNFGITSYWIYQDQDLNTDSIVLMGRGLTMPSNQSVNKESISLTFNNKTNGTSYEYYLHDNRVMYNGGTDEELGQPIYISHQTEGYEFGGLEVLGKVASITILDSTYTDVDKMRIHADAQIQDEFEFDRDIYFAPGIGVVREVIYDTENGTITRDLKEYRIEKHL